MTAQPPPSTQPARRAAVLGSPVAHSLSPVLHRAAYRALGLGHWRYQAVEVDERALPGFLAGLDASWAGLSLTMPLKQAVRPHLVTVSPLAAAVGAVNTVTFGAGGPAGDNTDVHGIVASLAEAGVVGVERGCVLGGGATAASAVAALSSSGCVAPTVVVRSPQRARPVLEAADRLGMHPRLVGWDDAPAVLRSCQVVVSTVPAGAADLLAARLGGSDGTGETWPPGAAPVLLDVVYAPWPTPLAQAWRQAGGAVVPGWLMLLHQAGEQVRLMTGLPAPLAAMRTALQAALKPAAGDADLLP